MCNEVEVLPSLTVFLNLQFPPRFEWIMSDFFYENLQPRDLPRQTNVNVCATAQQKVL